MTVKRFNCAFCEKEQPNKTVSSVLPCEDKPCVLRWKEHLISHGAIELLRLRAAIASFSSEPSEWFFEDRPENEDLAGSLLQGLSPLNREYCSLCHDWHEGDCPARDQILKVPLKPYGKEQKFDYVMLSSNNLHEDFTKNQLYEENSSKWQQNLSEIIDRVVRGGFDLTDSPNLSKPRRCADCGIQLTDQKRKVKRCPICLYMRKCGYYKCTCLVWHASGQKCPLRAWGKIIP